MENSSFKIYFIIIILGSVVGLFIDWGFEGFNEQPNSYFYKTFLKYFLIAVLVVVTATNIKKKK